MSRQYPLPLPHREAMEADDFMVTESNREAIAWIDRWPEWPSHCLVIHGPEGAGKTHLAHVWEKRSGSKVITACELTGDTVAFMASGNIAIDDADAVASDEDKEEALFHLYNMIKEAKGSLLLLARQAPARWAIQLPDLRSRLLAAQAISLSAADDDLLSALLVKQFFDRQLDIGTDVIDFILPRIERTPAAIRVLAAELDLASLAEGKRITISLTRKVLENRKAS